MRRILQRSVFALLLAWCAAAAAGVWQPTALRHFARLVRPQLPDISLAQPARSRKPENLSLARTRPAPARFEAAGEDLADYCPACLDAPISPLPMFDAPAFGAGATLAEDANFELFDPAFGDVAGSVYMVSFTPSGVATPTPEISTAAMLTLGLAGVAWATRHARRPAPRPSPAPRAC